MSRGLVLGLYAAVYIGWGTLMAAAAKSQNALLLALLCGIGLTPAALMFSPAINETHDVGRAFNLYVLGMLFLMWLVVAIGAWIAFFLIEQSNVGA